MKKLILTLFLTLLVTSCTAAEGSGKEEKPMQAQTNCPIRGGEIDKEVFTDYQGQRIYYCCPGCDKKFLQAPDKYLNDMKAKGITPAKIQTSCPVSDEPVTTGDVIYKSSEGPVALCCKKCLRKMQAKPVPYLLKLKKQGITIGAIAQPEADNGSAKKSHSDHSDHDHSGHKH
ncbi:YHS domain-containing protein [Lentisphaera marina]|uniref:YHS domain-containing protein n=1 Tax=Lentisphaera marina TaxID=1111041 RepID=UPI0023665A42|nr:YHS domain-containing protein [Lentisphaera marina]MDD7984368.1 YHS domain-containing protein [Lentisphaera marina]